MISTVPLLPSWLIAVLVIALASSAIVLYRRVPLLLGLRLAVVALLTVVLLNPVRIPTAGTHDSARLALVIDTSASMGLNDGGPATRLTIAREALRTAAAAAGGRFVVEWWTLSDVLRTGEPGSTAGDTVFDPLISFAEHPPAAVILASDGADRGVSPPDDALAGAGVPVSCIAVGVNSDASNLAVRLDAPSPTAFPNQAFILTATIHCTPAFAGRQTELSLAIEGGETTSRTFTIRDGERLILPVSSGDTAGERVWTASVPDFDGEATTLDNASTCAVRVVDAHLRTVVAEGRPWWDSGVAVRSWRRDRQLATIAHWRAGSRTLSTGGTDEETLKADAASLSGADLIVLGLEPERILDKDALAAIPVAVANGAGLILLAPGQRDESLAALDPVLWSSEPPRELAATAAIGAASLVPVELLPGLPHVFARSADGLRPGASLLLGEPAYPLAVLRRHGAGRVIAVNAEGLWRWNLGRSEDAAGQLWRQLARLAVRDPGGLSADRPRYRVGQTARLSASSTSVKIATPNAVTRDVPLSDGAAAVLLDQPGLWRIESGDQRLTLPVESDVRELTDTASQLRRLERLSSTSGGSLVTATEAASLGARLARRAELMTDAPRPVPLTVAWWWWTLILVAMVGTEWWLRRIRYGRV